MGELGKSEKGEIKGIYKTLIRFREVDGEMPVQQMLVLLFVAANEGSTQRDLTQALDMAASTASRNLAALSKVHRLGRAGHGLIDWKEDVLDRRVKRLHLTPRGRQFMKELLEIND